MASVKTLPTRPLGKNGPLVPHLGLGLMSASGQYDSFYFDEERLVLLDEAYKRGARFWDTADKYGDSEDVEYSLLCTEIELPERRLLEVACELGVAVVGYSPLGNGLLTGAIRSRKDVSKPGDPRGHLPWLCEANVEANVEVVDRIAEIARKKGVSTPQLALAWLLKQGDDIFPIPGSSRIKNLVENLDSSFVQVSGDEEKALRLLGHSIIGGRFQTKSGFTFGDTPALEE